MQQNYLLQQIKMIKLCEPIKSMQRSHARGTGGGWQLKETSHTLAYTLRHTHCATHTHTHIHNTRAALAAVAVSCNNCSICSQRVSDRRPKTIPAVATRLLRATHTHTVCHTHTHTHTRGSSLCVSPALSVQCSTNAFKLHLAWRT